MVSSSSISPLPFLQAHQEAAMVAPLGSLQKPHMTAWADLPLFKGIQLNAQKIVKCIKYRYM
jgi:hypothetical protein